MAGKVRHLVNRSGRYHVRLVVPKELRGIVGKTELRNDPRWPSVGIDDLLVQRLRDAIAGRASDAELTDLVGPEIKRFRAAGNLDAAPGSDEWRMIARALCSAELEALARVAERDEGDLTGKPQRPNHQECTAP